MSNNKKRCFSIAAACFSIQAVGIGCFVTYGVFFNSLLTEFGWSRAVISGASSCAFLFSGLFAILVGRLSDQYGPRKLMSIAAIFFGTGFVLMSKVTEVWQLYLYYGVIFGIGLSAIDVVALTTTARWFTRSRGLMTGIVKVGTGAGQFSIPFLASVLIIQYGWRNTYIIIGIFALVSLFLVAQVLQRDPDEETNKERKANLSTPNPPPVKVEGLTVKEAIGTVQMWLLCGITMLTVYCLITILVHIVPHSGDIGLSTVKAAGVLSTIGAVSMVGRFVCGIAIDRFGCRLIMFTCFLVLVSSLVWLQIAESLWMLYLFAAIYGLAHGGFFTVISPIVVEIFGLASHGGIFGIVVFSGTAGGSVGPIVAGKIFDMTNSYSTVFVSLTVMSIVCLGLVLLLRPVVKTTEIQK